MGAVHATVGQLGPTYRENLFPIRRLSVSIHSPNAASAPHFQLN